MGHATVPLYKLKDYLDKESWLTIHPLGKLICLTKKRQSSYLLINCCKRNPRDLMELDAEKVSGEICVKITETMMESSQVPVAKATAENPGTDK